MTPEQALATLERLRSGYTDKSGSGYPAAETNEAGCTLVRKGANRLDNGYVQIAPVVLKQTRALKGAPRKNKTPPQGAHRLVVVAHKT